MLSRRAQRRRKQQQLQQQQQQGQAEQPSDQLAVPPPEPKQRSQQEERLHSQELQSTGVLAPRPQTPGQHRQHASTGLDTPGAEDAPGTGASSPKMAMLCPQPRRIFAPLPAAPASENPPGSPWSSQDEACNELRELMAGGKDPRLLFDAHPAFESRPLSSQSTSAGPTPSPEDRAGTPAQERAGTPWTSPDYDAPAESDAAARQPDAESGREKTALPSQVRKVFVGGIPQNMTQDDLYTIFSEFAGVKKAWLQRHRTAGTLYSTPPRNHRGFGFVIFHEGSAVDKLLGSSSSRFIMLRDDRKLEVKRAVSSNDMMTTSASGSVGSSQQAGSQPQGPPSPKWPASQRQGRGSSQGSSQVQVQAQAQNQGQLQGQGQDQGQGQGQGQGQQAPGSPWPDAQWLGQLQPVPQALPPLPPLPQQSTGLAAVPPWPGSSGAGVPSVMPQAISPAYSGVPVPGMYVANSSSPNMLVQQKTDVAQMVQGSAVGRMARESPPEPMVHGRAPVMLAHAHAVCDALGGHVARQPWAVEGAAHGLHMALGQPRGPAATPPRAPQPQWSQGTSGSSACAVQWPGPADIRRAPGAPDADRHSPGLALTEASGTRGSSGPGALSRPPFMMQPEPQPQSQPVETFNNNKELESALLQAMPDYYED